MLYIRHNFYGAHYKEVLRCGQIRPSSGAVRTLQMADLALVVWVEGDSAVGGQYSY